MMNIILCGLPGSGKTEIGKIIAEQVNKPLLDTDNLIESRYNFSRETNLSCREIHKKIGEEAFRSLEHAVIASLVIYKDYIIATGGGIVENIENMSILKSVGSLIYLAAPNHVLLKRILAKGMPAYLNTKDPINSFEIIAKKRIPIYETFCDFLIDTDNRTPSQVAEMICQIKKNKR